MVDRTKTFECYQCKMRVSTTEAELRADGWGFNVLGWYCSPCSRKSDPPECPDCDGKGARSTGGFCHCAAGAAAIDKIRIERVGSFGVQLGAARAERDEARRQVERLTSALAGREPIIPIERLNADLFCDVLTQGFGLAMSYENPNDVARQAVANYKATCEELFVLRRDQEQLIAANVLWQKVSNERSDRIKELEAERNTLHEILQSSDHKSAHERAIKMRQQIESLREERDRWQKQSEARLEQLNRQGVAFGEQLAELREKNAELRDNAAAEGKIIQRERLQQIRAVVDRYESDLSADYHAELRQLRQEQSLAERVEALINKSNLAQYDSVVRERFEFQQQVKALESDLHKATDCVVAEVRKTEQAERERDHVIGEYHKLLGLAKHRMKDAGEVAFIERAITAIKEDEIRKMELSVEKGPMYAPPSTERVDHPPHYQKHPSGLEAIDLCERLSFNYGNAVKYLWRAGYGRRKVEDLPSRQSLRGVDAGSGQNASDSFSAQARAGQEQVLDNELQHRDEACVSLRPQDGSGDVVQAGRSRDGGLAHRRQPQQQSDQQPHVGNTETERGEEARSRNDEQRREERFAQADLGSGRLDPSGTDGDDQSLRGGAQREPNDSGSSPTGRKLERRTLKGESLVQDLKKARWYLLRYKNQRGGAAGVLEPQTSAMIDRVVEHDGGLLGEVLRGVNKGSYEGLDAKIEYIDHEIRKLESE